MKSSLNAATPASVTGAVGSVTGNVGGNVAGSVASVTGTVGSVIGNVGGNVVGSVASVTGAVGSVTAGVTVTTNNDKTGYALTAGEHTSIQSDAATGILVTPANKISTNASNQVVASSVQGNVTGSVASVTGAVGSVMAGVTVTTNNDKAGYALTVGEHTSIQSDAATGILVTPANKISTNASNQVVASSVQGNVTGSVGSVVAGVTVTTNNDKTGYSLTAGEESAIATAVAATILVTPANKIETNASNQVVASSVQGNVTGNVVGSVGSVTSGVTVTTNNDKTGYSLTVGEESAIATAVAAAILLTPANKIATNASNQVVSSSVQGNVTGSVGSVVGNVGGSVASVTAAVTVGTNNDKTGYSLTVGEESAIASAVATAILVTPANKIATNASNQVVASSVQGDVTGSVASVTGAVGSVTGAVGSVTGNVDGNVVGSVGSVTSPVTVGTNNDKTGYALTVGEEFAIATAVTAAILITPANKLSTNASGQVVSSSVQGNVTGSVASVTGAVGSVTGNVGGNVAGSVDSVTNPVTVGTNNDKTGYTLTVGEEAAIAAAVATAILVTPANKLATNASNQVVASSVQGNVTGSVASVTGDVGGKVLGGGASALSAVGVRAENIPLAAPGANGGLPTVDGNNRIVGIQGTKHNFDDLSGASGYTLQSIGDKVDGVQSSVNNVSNVTRLSTSLPVYMNRPASSDIYVKVVVALKDSSGSMEDPDSNETCLTVTNSLGTSRNSKLYKDGAGATPLDSASGIGGYKKLERTGVGLYFFYYKIESTAAEEELLFDFAWLESAVELHEFKGSQISDATNDLNHISGHVDDIHAKLPTNYIMGSGVQSDKDDEIDAIKTKTDQLSFTGTDVNATLDGEKVQVSGIDAAVITSGVFATDAIDANALKADAASEIAAAVDTTLSASHGAGAWGGTGLSQQQVRDAMKLAPTAGLPATDSIDDKLDTIDTTDTAIKAKTDNLPASPAATGDQMDLINTPNATAVSAIQSGLATAANLALVAGDVTSIKSTVDTNLDALVSSRASQTSVTNAAGDVTAIKARTDQLNFTGTDVKATLDGEKVQVSGLDTDTITSSVLAASAVSEISADVDSVLSAAHGSGAWNGAGISAQEVRDAMKLAPTAGVPAADSIDEKLDTLDTEVLGVKAKTDNLPASPAATGDKMDIVNAPNATAITAIQSGLATASALSAVDSNVTSTKSTVDTNLDAQVSTRASQSSLNSAAGDITSIKSTVDTNLDATVSSRASQSSVTSMAGDVTAIKAKTDQLNFTGTDVKATLDGEKVQVSGIDADVVNASALATDAVTEIAGGVDTTLSSSHGAGAWDGPNLTHPPTYINPNGDIEEMQV